MLMICQLKTREGSAQAHTELGVGVESGRVSQSLYVSSTHAAAMGQPHQVRLFRLSIMGTLEEKAFLSVIAKDYIYLSDF